MTMDLPFERRRVLPGAPYPLEEFQTKYRAPQETAKKLFQGLSPSSVELDLLTAATETKPSTDDRRQTSPLRP